VEELVVAAKVKNILHGWRRYGTLSAFGGQFVYNITKVFFMKKYMWCDQRERKLIKTWLFSVAIENILFKWLKRVIIILILGNLFLIFFLYQEFFQEINLIYRNDHVQSFVVDDLRITTYGPEMLVKGQAGEVTVVCGNEGSMPISDLQVALLSSEGLLRFTTDEAKVPNALQIDHLSPGQTMERSFEIFTLDTEHVDSIPVDVKIFYRVGGLNSALTPVSTDAQILSLNPLSMEDNFSERVEPIVRRNNIPDLHLRIVYKSQVDSQSANTKMRAGELLVTARSEQPLLHDLDIAIYTNSDGPYLDFGSENTNLMHFGDLRFHEEKQQVLPITLMQFSDPVTLTMHIDYSVAQKSEGIVQRHIPDAFAYSSSQFTRLHSRMGGGLHVLGRALSFVEQFSSIVTGLAAALAALVAVVFIRPLKYLRGFFFAALTNLQLRRM
jgi:hypothetical protein